MKLGFFVSWAGPWCFDTPCFWIVGFEIAAGIFDFHLKIDAALSLVAVVGQGGDFGTERFQSAEAAAASRTICYFFLERLRVPRRMAQNPTITNLMFWL